MIVGLDPQSPVPPYEQLRGQIAGAIARGELRAEERLPTVRQLAADLRLAVNTVARAYRELEARRIRAESRPKWQLCRRSPVRDSTTGRSSYPRLRRANAPPRTEPFGDSGHGTPGTWRRQRRPQQASGPAPTRAVMSMVGPAPVDSQSWRLPSRTPSWLPRPMVNLVLAEATRLSASPVWCVPSWQDGGMERVLGIGGYFIGPPIPRPEAWISIVSASTPMDRPVASGRRADGIRDVRVRTDYFGSTAQQTMINFRVR